ncbi:MAG: ABC transporter ATPase [Acidobacteriota bacterium]
MRELTDHIVSGDQAVQLKITVTDDPGAGGANHAYSIEWDQPNHPDSVVGQCFIGFQNGPIRESGVNGITQEALLAIVIDRLRSFQAGPFANDCNALALEHCDEALNALQSRTWDRIKRGVEGTSQK